MDSQYQWLLREHRWRIVLLLSQHRTKIVLTLTYWSTAVIEEGEMTAVVLHDSILLLTPISPFTSCSTSPKGWQGECGRDPPSIDNNDNH